MAEIFSICDRVSVYRDGQYIGTGTTTELDEGQLIKMMVGREITDVYPKLEADIGEVVFEAKKHRPGRQQGQGREPVRPPR